MDQIIQRRKSLAISSADRTAIGLPLAVVSELSSWLEEEYGMVHADSLEHWWSRLKARVSKDEYDEVCKIFIERTTAAMAPEGAARLDSAFYDFLARDPL